MMPAVAGCHLPAGPADEHGASIRFINETPVLGPGIERNKRLVRSHVSKLNRQRTKDHETQRLRWTANLQKRLTSQKSIAWSRVEDGADSSFTLRRSEETSEHNEADPGVLCLQSISPLFGGLRTEAFTRDKSVDASANYCKL